MDELDCPRPLTKTLQTFWFLYWPKNSKNLLKLILRNCKQLKKLCGIDFSIELEEIFDENELRPALERLEETTTLPLSIEVVCGLKNLTTLDINAWICYDSSIRRLQNLKCLKELRIVDLKLEQYDQILFIVGARLKSLFIQCPDGVNVPLDLTLKRCPNLVRLFIKNPSSTTYTSIYQMLLYFCLKLFLT